jgi:hypothetical protein
MSSAAPVRRNNSASAAPANAQRPPANAPATPAPAAAPATATANATGKKVQFANGTKQANSNGSSTTGINASTSVPSVGRDGTTAATNGKPPAAPNNGRQTPLTFPAEATDTWLSFKILGIFLVVALGLFYIMKSNLLGRIYNKLSSAPSDANNASIAQKQLGILREPAAESAEKRKSIFAQCMDKIKESFTNIKESFLSASDIAALPEVPATAAAEPTQANQNPLLARMQAPNLPKVNLPNLGLDLMKAREKKQTAVDRQLTISCDKMPPEDERALLNFAVLGCRVAGYLGPRMNGVFAEEAAVESAIKMGCRLFVLDIDYLDAKPSKPVLVCRDENGNLLSNNTGSIQKVAASLIAYTRRQRGAGTDPILVLLNIQRLPGGQPKGRQALQFMSEIARQLTPMSQYLLRSTDEGDAQQQRLQDVLFKLPITRFENQVILLTNVDTSGFRDREAGEFEPQRDLDLLVNARVFTNEDKALNNYQFPTDSSPATAVANTWSYYTTIPPANYNNEIEKTRHTFSIAMMRALGPPPSPEDVDTLVNKLGVQGIIVHPFPNVDQFAVAEEKKQLAAGVYSPSFFESFSFIPKAGILRYKQPTAIVVPPADPKLNANGGLLTAPVVNP